MRRASQRDAKARFIKVTHHESQIRSLQTEVAKESHLRQKLKKPVTARLPDSASPSTKPLPPNMPPQTIRCSSIAYRKGFVEVSRVHDGCVNLESWSVNSEVEISGVDIRDERIDDEDITGNVELELGIEAAERLIAALQAAVDELRGHVVA